MFRCEACAGGGVLVKLADLGVCVNPRAYRHKMSHLQRFIPECVEDGDLFTDKVNKGCSLQRAVHCVMCTHTHTRLLRE